MKKTGQAVLLSALVFPGSGHFFLKRYIVGSLLASGALVATYFLVSGMINKALELANKIKSGEIQPDISVITELLSRQSVGGEFQLMNTAVNFLIIVWLVGIADSYRIARQQDFTSVEVK